MVVGISDDLVAMIPRDNGVRRDVQCTAESNRVSFSDVTISQFRSKLEYRSTRFAGIDSPVEHLID